MTRDEQLAKDFERLLHEVRTFGAKWQCEPPQLIFNREWVTPLRGAGIPINYRVEAKPSTYCGVSVRFGDFLPAVVLREF